MFFSSKVISFRNGPKRAILNLKTCFEDKKAVLLPANFLQTFGGKVWGVNDLLAQTSASCMILKQVYWKAHFKARRPPHLLGCLTILTSEGIFCCPCIGFMGCQTCWHILEWEETKSLSPPGNVTSYYLLNPYRH